MYRPTYIFSTGLFRPDIFARLHQEVFVHCRLVHCGLVRCRLKVVLLRIFFSDLIADVFSGVGRWKIVLFSCLGKGGCRQYRPSPTCTSHIYRLLACMPVPVQRELLSTCPHRRKHLSNLKMKSEEKQASSGNAPSRSSPRPPQEDGRKCPAETGL